MVAIRVVTDWGKLHDMQFCEMRAPWHVTETRCELEHEPSQEELMQHYCSCGHSRCFISEHRNDPAFQKEIEMPDQEFCTNSAPVAV